MQYIPYVHCLLQFSATECRLHTLRSLTATSQLCKHTCACIRTCVHLCKARRSGSDAHPCRMMTKVLGLTQPTSANTPAAHQLHRPMQHNMTCRFCTARGKGDAASWWGPLAMTEHGSHRSHWTHWKGVWTHLDHVAHPTLTSSQMAAPTLPAARTRLAEFLWQMAVSSTMFIGMF